MAGWAGCGARTAVGGVGMEQQRRVHHSAQHGAGGRTVRRAPWTPAVPHHDDDGVGGHSAPPVIATTSV